MDFKHKFPQICRGCFRTATAETPRKHGLEIGLKVIWVSICVSKAAIFRGLFGRESLENVCRYFRDGFVNKHAGRPTDRPHREHLAAAGGFESDDFGAAFIRVHSLGQRSHAVRRRGRHLIRLVSRGAAGHSQVLALLAKQVPVLKAGVCEAPMTGIQRPIGRGGHNAWCRKDHSQQVGF